MTPEEWAAQWLKLEGTHTPNREYLLAGTFRAAIAEEREACAEIAERGPRSLMEENDGTTYADNVAAEIRDRK